ncbi:MAG: ribonuclease P protein component [bacterium]
MLSKKERIPKALFDTYSKKTKAFPSNSFILRAHFTKDGTSRRFSVIVSKKVAKKSVDRHAIKRSIYNILREKKDSFPTGYYFIFVNKNEPKQLYQKEFDTVMTNDQLRMTN